MLESFNNISESDQTTHHFIPHKKHYTKISINDYADIFLSVLLVPVLLLNWHKMKAGINLSSQILILPSSENLY